ncbi:MAG: glycosyltransferase family 4 protein [Myxacorys chilensis ATA2-1-KO14]|jgi:glycosyltransferase involved in cell wall biosynthesis|nr:glycosyltransferase family 4 protein [Myxacorys chilensis ATA2-1-KO14]
MTHIALLFTNYGPYHLARLNAMHQLCQDLNWQVTAIELARAEADYEWRTSVEHLPYPFITITENQQLEAVNPIKLGQSLIKTLERVQPDAIAIMGYFRPSMLMALMWGAWTGKARILFSATKEDDAPRRWWQEQVKRTILKQFQAALVGGNPQKRYLTKLGMLPEQIVVGYNVVGNDAFHPSKIRSLPPPIARPFFLSINRFIPKKNLSNLISAYAAYSQQAGSQAWDLVLCGDGQLRPQLEQQIAELGLSDRIHLPGFLQQDELLPYFAHAGCFVHASTQEQWGLVVNEAMAAGLPVLVSNRCGCFEDLVIEGINGWGFDPDNIEQMTGLMVKMSSEMVDAEAMGTAALSHIQKFSPAHFAQGLSQAVRVALSEAQPNLIV